MRRVLFILILFCACSDKLIVNDSASWIKNLIINIDRANNELYIQAETISQYFQDYNSVDSVTVNLEYVGSGNLEYNRTFLLYDNGENGDIISANGIYTLVDNADKVDSPNEQLDIININFPTYFELNNINSDIILFDITIKGKKYLATANLFENGNIHSLDQYFNIDNTQLEIQKNLSNLYIDDDDDDGICNRIADKYGDVFSPILFEWPDARFTEGNDFIYESGFTVNSMQDCASTGEAIFRFILNDLDTGESVQEDRAIILYGCGDGICEQNYESINTCFEDCSNE